MAYDVPFHFRVSLHLSGRGLPNLWVPRERDFFAVSELPVLGSGKVDLKTIREIALAKMRG